MVFLCSMKATPKRKPSPNPRLNRDARLGPPKSKDARRVVLAQWRRIDLAEVEKALTPSAKTVASIMPNVLTHLGLNRRRTEAEVARVWNNLIDPNIVAHAKPTGLRNGTLFVTVDHSVWLNEIVRYRRKEILNRLQYSFGPDLIARISFRLG